jgi:hypothetical protein
VERVIQGQRFRIRADDYNAFVDAAEDFRRRRGAAISPGIVRRAHPGEVFVRNDTGFDQPQGRALEIGDILTDIPDASIDADVMQGVVVEGLTPSAGCFRPLAVLREPIPEGEIGRAVLEGIVAARVTLRSTLHRFADVSPGSPILRSRGIGRFEILSLPPAVTVSADDDDPRWALVRRVADGVVRILARITGSTVLTTNRWEYSWEEVDITEAGAIEVIPAPGGRTHANSGKALNSIEFPNTGIGVEGNGVDRDNLPPTFTMQPITTGNVVVLEGPFGRGTEPTKARWLFAIPNADDGVCEGAEV